MSTNHRQHGSTDALGLATWDFSSNANACGPCPAVALAVQQTHAQHYPDPAYTRLRTLLAEWHGVSAERIWLGTSASEWMQRFSGWSARRGRPNVWWPVHAYGDVAHAAAAWGLQRVQRPSQASLIWLCEPSTPLGQLEDAAGVLESVDKQQAITVLDCAYQPLRLDDEPCISPMLATQCWQLWSPNKALGMAGVRAAYVVAPLGAEWIAAELEGMAASWPIGSHGVALLEHWCQPVVQRWVRNSLPTLKQWKTALMRDLTLRGWQCLPSLTSYFCARPPAPIDPKALRERGIKLRDTTSFGLPGWWRLSAQPDAAREALMAALDSRVVQELHP